MDNTGANNEQMGDNRTARVTPEEALAMHAEGRPGKLETRLTKPLTTARDLSLAYSPGVAEPCLHIHRDHSLAYDYTSKGNFVAVVSNGTAVWASATSARWPPSR
jgi:malate dehydrogenase (oxaloacetate-decarboxylating)(NADP+)